MADPVLLEHERQSALWMKIKQHLGRELDALRRRNDGDMDERKTAELRGQIRQVKKLMALDNPGPVVEANDIE